VDIDGKTKMKTEPLISAYVDTEGKVIAITEKGCFKYQHKLSESGTKKLMALLGKHNEINTEHWVLEWEKEACGIDSSQENKK